MMEYLAKCAAVRGTHVIAKGVETPGMRDILKEYAISSMQGNFYAKALSADDILEKYD